MCCFSAEKLKRDFDQRFGAPWNVIVGEAYSFDIDYDFHFLYYFLYGPVAILCWRVRSLNITGASEKSELQSLQKRQCGLFNPEGGDQRF